MTSTPADDRPTPIRPDPADPLAAVLQTMDLHRVDETTFTSVSLYRLNNRIYGGQVLAQSVLAAGATVPSDPEDGRFLHSVQGYFLRPGKPELPITFTVELLHDGRSFSTRRTHALQEGVPILSFISSYQKDQEGYHLQRRKPPAPLPEQLPSSLDLFAAQRDNPVARHLAATSPLDVRHCERPIYLEPDPDQHSTQNLWVRLRSPLPEGSDPLLHKAMLAYACDELALEPVLRSTGLCFSTPGLSMASLDHSMHFHRRVDMNRWHLFTQRAISAYGGRGKASADVFDEEGRHVASLTQEGMVRAPLPGAPEPPTRSLSGPNSSLWEGPS